MGEVQHRSRPMTTAILPNLSTKKRFIGFYTLMSEMCETEQLTGVELQSRLRWAYEAEQERLHRWMAMAQRGQFYRSTLWVVLCVRGARS